ncbi:unnamed protein product [Chrysoparadoxa australica]
MEAKEADSSDSECEGKAGEGEGKAGECEGKADEADIVSAVANYFYNNERFAKRFEDFCLKASEIIDLESTEEKLEYTEAYNDYQDLFEQELTDFIEAQGSTALEFYEQLRAADPFSADAIFGSILKATCDYDIFKTILVDMARQREETRRK